MRIEDTKKHLKRLYDGVEAGALDPYEPALAERMAGLRGIHEQAQADAERIEAMLASSSHKAIAPAMIHKLGAAAREKIRIEGGGYRRDHLRAPAQRAVRIMDSKSSLLRTLTGVPLGKRLQYQRPVLY